MVFPDPLTRSLHVDIYGALILKLHGIAGGAALGAGIAIMPVTARAECFNCNYGLAIYILASIAVAVLTAGVAILWYVFRRRVPVAVIVILGLSAAPPAAFGIMDWLGLG